MAHGYGGRGMGDHAVEADWNGEEQADVAIYRPFFLAGIASVLTTGCLLGAIALAGISATRGYGISEWSPYILAHANSQLYGWVGLFVMGFALQQHPPRVGRRALFHRFAWGSLVLIAAGIVLRFIAEPLVAVRPGLGIALGLASATLQAVAVFVFVANIGMTRHRGLDLETGERARLPWQSLFVFASLGWWMVAAVAESVVFAGVHQAASRSNTLFIATWASPYRDLQFLGFVANMIFGVALARFSSDLGAPPASRPLGLIGFGLWNVGLLGRCAGWVLYVRAGMAPDRALIYHVGGVLLLVAALLLIVGSGLFVPARTPAPGRKFVRAAMGWLLVVGLLMLLEPLHLRAIGGAFSHAYTGAIRHALTVGFISQMIIGVSMTVVPLFAGRLARPDSAPLQPLWAAFWLLNVGNALRVASQIATDYTPHAFALMGATGFVELVGIAVWARAVGGRLIRLHPLAVSAIGL